MKCAVCHVRSLWLKQRTIEECRRRDFNVADHNDADAIALLAYRLSQLSKDFRLVQPPHAATPDEFLARCESGKVAA